MEQEQNKNRLIKRVYETTGARLFFGYVGMVMAIIGLMLLVPLFILIWDHESSYAYYWFLVPGLCSIAVGLTLFFTLSYKKKKGRLKKWESYLLLLVLWMLAIFIGSIPYLMSGYFTFSQCIFESASGITTTALTIITDEQSATIGMLFQFYRCWMLFVGGVGLTLIITSAISDANGLSLYNLEGHNDRLLPNLIKSARLVFLIYFAYIVIGVIAYVCCGMPVFDAVCNSIGALSTGGYALHETGLSYYNSVGVEVITCILMLLGCTNFMIHFAIFKGKFKSFFYHSELFCALIMALLFLPPIIAGFNYTLQAAAKFRSAPELNNPALAFRYGIFYYISVMTTTGFKIDPYWLDTAKFGGATLFTFENFPTYVFVSGFLIMLVGGQVGSTTGGIKQMRIVQVFKQCYWHIRGIIDDSHIVHSHTIIRYGRKERLDTTELHSASAFIIIYIAILLLGTFAFTCCDPNNYRFDYCLMTFTSILSNSGVASGLITTTSPVMVYWISTLGMIIGRLEPVIFVLIVARGLKSGYNKTKRALTIRKLEK